jgi:hypothetical protein
MRLAVMFAAAIQINEQKFPGTILNRWRKRREKLPE